MKKWVLLLCMLMAAMLMTGCALVEKDEAVDMQTTIVSLGDFSYNKGQVLSNVDYYEYMYSLYGYSGMDHDVLIDDVIESLKQDVLEQYMIKELGLDQLTEEEKTTLEEKVKAARESERQWVQSNYFGETELEGEELEKAIDEKMVELGYTDEAFEAQEKGTLVREKLNKHVTDGVTVTEEEAKANYDEAVAAAKTNYETNLSTFGSSYNAGSQIYYTPAGYRNIQNLQVAFLEEDTAAIADINTQLTSAKALVTSTQESVDSYGTEELTEEQNTALEGLKADLLAAQTKQADLEVQLTKATETAYVNIAPTVTEIRGKLEAGEAFKDLMTTYGSDAVNVNQATGYAICEGFTGKPADWVAAAMALAQVGDVTKEDIRVSNGINILYYAGDLQEGEVGFDSVKELDAITKLTEKKSDAYNAQIETWLKEHPVKVDRNAMN